ncbi:hypothetical protein ACTU6U_01515 [Microbacterium sp. A196]|uniref:hypothetical protein n=1 Tax=unclassified Microbacterium TaxID=2609290 RepID=UPI003FD60FBA
MFHDEPDPIDETGSDGAAWNNSDAAFSDPTGMKMFAEEIDNVDVSDWDVDSDSLWGDEGTNPIADIGDGTFDIDFLG